MSLLFEKVDLSGRTVIIGCAGAGGVGQLAADLLVASCGAVRVAPIWSAALPPIAGPSPYAHDDGLACPAALYVSPSAPIAVLPFRSPPCGRLVAEFAVELVRLLKECGAAKVVALAGHEAVEKRQIESTSFRYVANGLTAEKDEAAIASLGWSKHDPELPVRGGKFAQRLHRTCELFGLPSLLLFKYCYEGDNLSAAEDIVRSLDGWLGALNGRAVTQPESWKYFYGPPIPGSIY